MSRPAAAVYIRTDRPVSEYNAIGLRQSFASSGYLTDTRDGFTIGSATLVSPTKVLTAAHVFDDDGNLKLDAPDQFARLSFGTQSFIPSRLGANVKSVVIHPAYKGAKDAYDLAVVTLKTPMTGVKPGRLSAANAVGRRGAMVGYGFQGTGIGYSITGATNKLGAFNEISVLRNGTYRTDFDSPSSNTSSFGSSVPYNWEGTTASGDSGGALWGDFGNNRWNVVGVLNGGLNDKGPDSFYGDISIYASLTDAKNIAFLRSQGLSLNGGFTGRPGPDEPRGTGRSATAVPEPGSALLVLAAGFCSLKRRRQPLARHAAINL